MAKTKKQNTKAKRTTKKRKKLTKKQQEFLKAQQQLAKKPQGLFGNIFFYAFLLFGVFLLITSVNQQHLGKEEVPINEVLTLIDEEKVQDVVVSTDDVDVLLRDGTKLYSKKEAVISFDQILANNNIDQTKILGELKIDTKFGFEEIITAVAIYGIPLFILFYIMRQMKGAGGDVMAFGKSKAKLFSKESSKITFNDVAGMEEAKKEMVEIVDFLKNPKKYQKLGARVPKGVLLVGSAGVGKTLLAKAVAGDASVPFYSVAGSEFMEMLVGVGSSRVRDLFKMAKASQPSLVFIDEIDAIGRQRGMGIGGGHDEREQTLNQILIEMDGFDPRTQVIVIAATNRPDMLDPALVRAGRFDRKITIPMPDLQDRVEILKIHMKGKPFTDEVDVSKVAKETVGYSGADLENMINEAAILAARDGISKITPKLIDNASLKVTLGPERRRLQNEDDKKMTAYHEAGHAIVAASSKDTDPVTRVTIVPRGGSLGHTGFSPERDRYTETKSRLLSMITRLMGGRAAEEIVFNELTTGASNDIERATDLARRMVTEYGMSSLGPIAYDGNEGSRFWVAKQMGETMHYSQAMASKIDNEIKSIIEGCYAEAKTILTKKRVLLDKISNVLIEKETIDADEFAALIG